MKLDNNIMCIIFSFALFWIYQFDIKYLFIDSVICGRGFLGDKKVEICTYVGTIR